MKNSLAVRAHHEAGHTVAAARSTFFRVHDVDILEGMDDLGGFSTYVRLRMFPGEEAMRGYIVADDVREGRRGVGVPTREGLRPMPEVGAEEVPRLLHDLVLVCMAGPAAEAAHLKTPVSGVTFDEWIHRPEFTDDLKGGNGAIPFVQRWGEGTKVDKVEFIIRVGLEARDLIEAEWATVRRLARALMGRRKLTGEEVRAILEPRAKR